MRAPIDHDALVLIVQFVQVTCWFVVGLIARDLGNDIANVLTSTAPPGDRFDVSFGQAIG